MLKETLHRNKCVGISVNLGRSGQCWEDLGAVRAVAGRARAVQSTFLCGEEGTSLESSGAAQCQLGHRAAMRLQWVSNGHSLARERRQAQDLNPAQTKNYVLKYTLFGIYVSFSS